MTQSLKIVIRVCCILGIWYRLCVCIHVYLCVYGGESGTHTETSQFAANPLRSRPCVISFSVPFSRLPCSP